MEESIQEKLKHWLEHGLITAIRTKDARNAPVLFSLDELNKVMMTMRAKRA